jgi:polyribonucleotide nucleotidyltransferase
MVAAKKFMMPEFGYEVEINKFAQQADGAVWLKQGGTVVLATVVSAPSKEFPGFFPLTVDYREQSAAAGKIPGGYYKREGRSTEAEILTGRLIDRAIRPLFPINYFDQVQVLATVYSVDKQHIPGPLSLLASSLALTISKIPFMGPIGVVQIARVNNTFIFDPLYADANNSDVRLVVAGTSEGICMVEGECNELSEEEIIDVFFQAHERIKKQIAWQESVQKELEIEKPALLDQYSIEYWSNKAEHFLNPEQIQRIYVADKVERKAQLDALRQEFTLLHQEEIMAQLLPSGVIEYVFDYMLNKKITEHIFALKKRIDGRTYDQIRTISVEVGLLPFTHGSALFTRGRTQALVTVTLGSGQDEQRTENIMEDETPAKAFMLHYNFPPFSVGEVRAIRGPGRREIGHGNLAASALRAVLPAKQDFPYTIRIVGDMLESDGSTSMATVCGSTMALMHAGVPIKNMVSGIAMGLLKSNDGDFAVLSDISGFEDAFGLMDFKVAGTQQGVTAVQMDIKYKGGLSRQVFERAFAQARQGREFILNEMRKVMTEPNPELSELVPKLIIIQIDTDKIGAVIGSGGKIIREIIEKSKLISIDIDPDGLVKIFGGIEADMEGAVRWVKVLAGQIEVGAVFNGIVRRIAEFGLFVELVPGQDGLVHVSNIPREKQRTFMRDFKPGDAVTVEIVDYDAETGRIRLRLLR